MGKSEIESAQKAVEGLHGGKASFRRKVYVIEESAGERVWEGDVFVFALEEHPTARSAYAWSVSIPGSERRRFYAVLHEGPVDSPEKAIRAAIIQAWREESKT